MSRVSDHRTGSKGRRRREEILEVAAGLFTTRGYGQVTAQDIADALGVAKSGLYYYFETKEEMLFSVLLRNQESLHRAVVDGTDYAQLAPLTAVGEFIARHVRYVLSHRAVSLLYADEGNVVRSVEPWWQALVGERRRHEDVLHALIERAQRDGVAAPDLDAALSTRALLALANAPLRWYHDGGPDSPESIAAHHAVLATRSLTD